MKSTADSAAAAHQHGLPNEVTTAEAERIAQRRAEAVRLGQMTGAHAEGVKGLALSGGGVRAAFVALGLLEKLAEHKALAQFDYISSVSGGGYAACMLTDHVGNLRKNTVFGHGPYRKTQQ